MKRSKVSESLDKTTPASQSNVILSTEALLVREDLKPVIDVSKGYMRLAQLPLFDQPKDDSSITNLPVKSLVCNSSAPQIPEALLHPPPKLVTVENVRSAVIPGVNTPASPDMTDDTDTDRSDPDVTDIDELLEAAITKTSSTTTSSLLLPASSEIALSSDDKMSKPLNETISSVQYKQTHSQDNVDNSFLAKRQAQNCCSAPVLVNEIGKTATTSDVPVTSPILPKPVNLTNLSVTLQHAGNVPIAHLATTTCSRVTNETSVFMESASQSSYVETIAEAKQINLASPVETLVAMQSLSAKYSSKLDISPDIKVCSSPVDIYHPFVSPSTIITSGTPLNTPSAGEPLPDPGNMELSSPSPPIVSFCDVSLQKVAAENRTMLSVDKQDAKTASTTKIRIMSQMNADVLGTNDSCVFQRRSMSPSIADLSNRMSTARDQCTDASPRKKRKLTGGTPSASVASVASAHAVEAPQSTNLQELSRAINSLSSSLLPISLVNMPKRVSGNKQVVDNVDSSFRSSHIPSSLLTGNVAAICSGVATTATITVTSSFETDVCTTTKTTTTAALVPTCASTVGEASTTTTTTCTASSTSIPSNISTTATVCANTTVGNGTTTFNAKGSIAIEEPTVSSERDLPDTFSSRKVDLSLSDVRLTASSASASPQSDLTPCQKLVHQRVEDAVPLRSAMQDKHPSKAAEMLNTLSGKNFPSQLVIAGRTCEPAMSGAGLNLEHSSFSNAETARSNDSTALEISHKRVSQQSEVATKSSSAEHNVLVDNSTPFKDLFKLKGRKLPKSLIIRPDSTITDDGKARPSTAVLSQSQSTYAADSSIVVDVGSGHLALKEDSKTHFTR